MKSYNRNPRKITSKQLEQLKANLQELGDLSGIVHDLNTDEIIAGNQRSKVIDINQCEVVITERYDTPNEQGTVAWGYVIFEGQKLNYRQVRWDEQQRAKACITANSLGGDWDFEIIKSEWKEEAALLSDWDLNVDGLFNEFPKGKRQEIFEDYDGFVEKFKPKKTTDDCYTPQPIMDAVVNYIHENVLNLDGVKILRPFYPGGDYESFDYSGNSVVIDNPPFSILAKIIDFYIERGIRFWLFAPHLTLFSYLKRECSLIVVNCPIVYENGAVVNTDFVTNMYSPDLWVKVDGGLHDILDDIDTRDKANLRDIEYPQELVSAALLGKIASGGVDFDIHRDDGIPIRKLDNQETAVFGSGILLRTTKARAEAKAKARAEAKAQKEPDEYVLLSDRERKMLDDLQRQWEEKHGKEELED